KNEPQILDLYVALAETYLHLRKPEDAIAQLQRASHLSHNEIYQVQIAAVKKLKFDGQPIARNFLQEIKLPDSSAPAKDIVSLKKKFADYAGNIYKFQSYEIAYSIEDYARRLR